MRFVTLNLAFALYNTGANGASLPRRGHADTVHTVKRVAQQDYNKDRPVNLHAGNSHDLSWQNLTCGKNQINDPAVPGAARWDISRADNAYASMIEDWGNHMDEGDWTLSFSETAARYFGVDKPFECTSIKDDTCNDMIQCDDAKTGPAGYATKTPAQTTVPWTWGRLFDHITDKLF